MQLAIGIRKKLEKVFNKNQADILTEVITDAYSDLVKTSDFNELKGIVKELAQAQKRTEIKVEELAQAQKRTEIRVEELAEAQKETQKEIVRLDRTVQQLAEAQKRTEIKVEELAQAQKRTEIKVQELAQAQKKTEEELHDLVKEHKKTRTQLGGLSSAVGYRLEDEAFKALPELLKRDYELIVQGKLKRKYITDNKGRKIEVNIIGEGIKNSKKVTIIGESKSQLSKNDVNEFIKKKLKRLDGIYKEIFPVLVTYMISEHDAEEYARKKGIALYYSYDF